MDSLPFHARGFIAPANRPAWEAMHRFSPMLDSIRRLLLRNLPDFITVLAPEQSGKTTFAFQAISDFSGHGGILTLYLDLQLLAGNRTESDFVSAFPAALDDSLTAAEGLLPTLSRV